MTTIEATVHEQIFSCETRAQKKELLRKLSKAIKFKMDMTDDDRTVNQCLIETYTNEEHQEFNNFWAWKKLGFKVKKGERAFFVWSKKRKGIDKTEGDGDDKEFSFFSLAYLFSNAQVEPLTSQGSN